jgi:quinoprotein glucose dehydrogenase
VPQSKVAGEKSAATQPFPTRPAPLDIQGLRTEDLIDLTPALNREALQFVARYDYGPLYTPPTERGLVQLPGVGGGASWSGASFDPETGLLYATMIRQPHLVRITRSPREPVDALGRHEYLIGPQRLPLMKPPFGSMVAIDMNTGTHVWRVPVGDGPRGHQAIRHLDIRERLGWNFRSWPLATKTLLFADPATLTGAPHRAGTPNRTVIDLNNSNLS